MEEERGNWKGLEAPLRAAAVEGHEEVVRLLLEKMLELAIGSEEGESSGEKLRKEVTAGLGWVKWSDLWDRKEVEGTLRTLLEFGGRSQLYG